MTLLKLYKALFSAPAGALSQEELHQETFELLAAWDAVLVHGNLNDHTKEHFLEFRDHLLRDLEHLQELDPEDTNARRQDLRLLKTDRRYLRHLFPRLHSTRRLNAILTDLKSLALWDAEFLATFEGTEHFPALLEGLIDYGNHLEPLGRLLRCPCFADASFNQVDPSTGRPFDWLALAKALEQNPHFVPPPDYQYHGSPFVGTLTRRPSDDAFWNDLEQVCELLTLDFDSVVYQVVTYAAGRERPGHPAHALRAGDFDRLARHTNRTLNFLSKLSGRLDLPLYGLELAKVVACVQSKWFNWLHKHHNDGRLNFELSADGLDLEFQLHDYPPTPLPETLTLYGYGSAVTRVDDSQEWLDTLGDFGTLSPPSSDDSDSDSDEDDDSPPEAETPPSHHDDDDNDNGPNSGDGAGQGTNGNAPDRPGQPGDGGDNSEQEPQEPANDPPNDLLNDPLNNPPFPSQSAGDEVYSSVEEFFFRHLLNRVRTARDELLVRRTEAQDDPSLTFPQADEDRLQQLTELEHQTNQTLQTASCPQHVRDILNGLPAQDRERNRVHEELWLTLARLFRERGSETADQAPFEPAELRHQLERYSDLLVAGFEAPTVLPKLLWDDDLDGRYERLEQEVVAHLRPERISFRVPWSLVLRLEDALGDALRALDDPLTEPTTLPLWRWRVQTSRNWWRLSRELSDLLWGENPGDGPSEIHQPDAPAPKPLHLPLPVPELNLPPGAVQDAFDALSPEAQTRLRQNPEVHSLTDLLERLREEYEDLRGGWHGGADGARFRRVRRQLVEFKASLLFVFQDEAARPDSAAVE